MKGYKVYTVTTTLLKHKYKESNDYNYHWSWKQDSLKLKAKKKKKIADKINTNEGFIFNSSLCQLMYLVFICYFCMARPFCVKHTKCCSLNWTYFEQVTEALLPELKAAPLIQNVYISLKEI